MSALTLKTTKTGVVVKYSAVFSALIVALGITPLPVGALVDCAEGDRTCQVWGARGAIQDEPNVRLRASRPNRIAALPAQGERELPRERLILWDQPNGTQLQEQVLRIENQEVLTEQVRETPMIRFESGRSIIDEEHTALLSETLDELRDKRNLRLRVIGHTDPQRLSMRAAARFGDNYGLGLSRAQEVGQILAVALDLDETQISYESRGPDEPIAEGNSAEAWRLNRRVEVEIWYDDVEIVATERLEDMLGGTLMCAAGQDRIDDSPFRLSIDGIPVDAHGQKNSADGQRCVDVALANDRIQLQYDNLSARPRLNITSGSRTAVVGEETIFQGYSNYLHWISRAEVIVYGASSRWGGLQELTRVTLDQHLRGELVVTGDFPEQLVYKLRVYDDEGRYDETDYKSLHVMIADENVEAENQESEWDLEAVFGTNSLQRHTIPVAGGTITVNGRDVTEGYQVYVLGQPTQIDPQGSFVSQQIIPRGLHTVEVAILDEDGRGRVYRRDLRLPQRDWFVVGMADLTIGQQNTSGPARLLMDDERYYDDKFYADGRIAFFARGEIDNTYTVTASMDTGEEPVRSLFNNFNDKNPREFLRRIDDNRSWGTFGDDSVMEELAPTRGKFYVKVEDVKSHVMWGNFAQQNSTTELTQIDRRLYGLQGVYQSDRFTAFGDRKLRAEAFAAEPGTAHAREEFLGTGGSLYFLRNQDITVGSESLRVEVRDADSGLVISGQYLTYGLDYEIDSIQGRIYLTRPLSSLVETDTPVRSGGSLGGNAVYLVVNYEYSPGFERLQDIAVGGRVSGWLSDNWQLGVTASSQENFGEKQDLGGVDVTYRHSEESWLRVEAAQSDGEGLSQFSSFDGGFQFGEESIVGENSRAYRVATNVNLKDVNESWSGNWAAYFEERDAGFAGPGRYTRYDTTQVGMRLNSELSDRVELFLKLDDLDEVGGNSQRSGDIALGYDLTERWQVIAGYRSEKRESELSSDGGSRDDLAIQLEYTPLEQNWAAYGFVQGTVKRTGNRLSNDRVGVGGRYRLGSRTNLLGEVSEGDLGFGAKAGIDYAASERTSVFMNYALDNDRPDFGQDTRDGQLVAGARSRVTDSTSVFTEQRYQHGSQMEGLIQGYGLDFAPNDRWSYALTTEVGDLRGDGDLSIRRKAASGSVGYETSSLRYRTLLEYREDKTQQDTRTTWMSRNNLSLQLNDDWRLLGKFDWAESDSDAGSFFDGRFTEASLGYAYRPVNHDRLNALVKVTHLTDLAPPDQISASGRRVDYSQRSNVVAVDAIYDLSARWSVGGRFAYRKGELRQGRDDSAEWFSSTGKLYAVRVDWRIVRKWDVMLELRERQESVALETSRGALVAAHYHFGKHVKAGVGYNFTDFSDDLTDMSFRSQGWFINILSTF